MSTGRKRNHEELTTYLEDFSTQDKTNSIEVNQAAEIISLNVDQVRMDTSITSQGNVDQEIEDLPEEMITFAREEVELTTLRNRYPRDQVRNLLNQIEQRNRFRFDPVMHNAINSENVLSQNAKGDQEENVKKRMGYLNTAAIFLNKKIVGELLQKERNGQMSKEDLSTLQNLLFTIQAEIYLLLCDNPALKCEVQHRETIIQPINAKTDIIDPHVNAQSHFLRSYPQFANHTFFSQDNSQLHASDKTFPEVDNKFDDIQNNAKRLCEVDTAEEFQKIWSEGFRLQCWLNGIPYKSRNGQRSQIVTDSLLKNVFLNAIKVDVSTSILVEMFKDNKRLKYLINRKCFHVESNAFLTYILSKSAEDDDRKKIIFLLNHITENSVMYYLYDEILKSLSALSKIMSASHIKNLWEIATSIESRFPKIYPTRNVETKDNEETSIFYTYTRHL